MHRPGVAGGGWDDNDSDSDSADNLSGSCDTASFRYCLSSYCSEKLNEMFFSFGIGCSSAVDAGVSINLSHKAGSSTLIVFSSVS